MTTLDRIKARIEGSVKHKNMAAFNGATSDLKYHRTQVASALNDLLIARNINTDATKYKESVDNARSLLNKIDEMRANAMHAKIEILSD